MKLAGWSVLVALAASGCVKQETVRMRAVPDFYKLCTDHDSESMCTPAQPLQVDTNLASPRQANPVGVG